MNILFIINDNVYKNKKITNYNDNKKYKVTQSKIK